MQQRLGCQLLDETKHHNQQRQPTQSNERLHNDALIEEVFNKMPHNLVLLFFRLIGDILACLGGKTIKSFVLLTQAVGKAVQLDNF